MPCSTSPTQDTSLYGTAGASGAQRSKFGEKKDLELNASSAVGWRVHRPHPSLPTTLKDQSFIATG